MKKSVFLLTLILVVGPLVAEASDESRRAFELSVNAALVSDYQFRGISQSDENFAFQGGFDARHDSGLHAGIWASGVDFNDQDQANIEIDLVTGFGGELDNGLSYDFGGIYYAYPGARNSLNYDFWEAYGSLSYEAEWGWSGLVAHYSPDYFGGSGDAQYVSASLGTDLPYDFNVEAQAGYQAIDDNAAFGTDDYWNWSLTFGYSYDSLDMFVAYQDTNLSEPSYCADGCETRLIFGLSTSFDL